ncbi:hypothetical protein [Zhongshania sp.]|jgi:hypothetical protein|uniref:hypothetical protein n=1 Tax=Zhongshania sp. TaxID=1971902 RepID=UPI0039E5AA9E
MITLDENNYGREERLGLMAKLFIGVLLIAIFEGAFRKWLSPSLTYPLVAIRDILATIGILFAVKKGYARFAPLLVASVLALSCMLVAWGMLQIILIEYPLVILIYGLRFWLLYLWFSIFVAISISAYDFQRIIKVLISLLIAMTPLAVIQHYSPVGSFWNKQIGESYIFTVVHGIVRTTGTFSFTAGFTTFVAFAAPFVLASLDRRYGIWRKQSWSFVAFAALLICTVVSGSRGGIIFFTVLLLSYVVCQLLFSRGRSGGSAIFILLLVGIMIAGSFSIFSRAVEATQQRFEAASNSQSFVSRLAYNFLPPGEVDLLGAGVGMGTNIAGVIAGGQSRFLLAETENARVVKEGGIFGWLILLFKIVVVLLGLTRGGVIAMRTGRLLSLMVWMTAGLALLSWSIIGQLTINVLGYLLVGLAIASLRLERSGQI